MQQPQRNFTYVLLSRSLMTQLLILLVATVAPPVETHRHADTPAATVAPPVETHRHADTPAATVAPPVETHRLPLSRRTPRRNNTKKHPSSTVSTPMHEGHTNKAPVKDNNTQEYINAHCEKDCVNVFIQTEPMQMLMSEQFIAFLVFPHILFCTLASNLSSVLIEKQYCSPHNYNQF